MTDFFEHISAYKAGKLQGEDLKAFEAELNSNKELQAAVDNHDVVEELLDLMWEDEVRDVVSNIPEDQVSETASLTTKPEAKTRSLKRFLPIAAAVLTLLAVGFLFRDNLSAPSNDELFVKHMSAYMGQTVRGDETLDKEISECDRGHYYLDSGDVETAKSIFENNLALSPDTCTNKSEWYLSLIYLKTGKESERNNLLQKILNNNSHPYYEKAVKLQADLQ